MLEFIKALIDYHNSEFDKESLSNLADIVSYDLLENIEIPKIEILEEDFNNIEEVYVDRVKNCSEDEADREILIVYTFIKMRESLVVDKEVNNILDAIFLKLISIV